MAGPPRSARLSLGQAVVLFGLASFLLVAAAGLVALRVVRPRLADHDVAEARRDVLLVAERIVEPAVATGVVAREPAAMAAFDRHVRERVLRPGVLQVKLWSADGTILYSDVNELIGSRFELEPEQRSLLAAGRGASARRSELDRDEHATMRGEVPVADPEVIEIYAVIDGPGGEPMLWESYVEPHSLVERAESLLLSLGLTGAGAASLVLAAQVLLALALARRVTAGRHARIDLLRRAAFAADAERRRIASDLHDGVVQDLHGLALDLDAAEGGSTGMPDTPAQRAAELAARLRRSLHDLRTLAADLHPADLHARGLRDALQGLLQTCDGHLDATLDVDGDQDLEDETRRLLFRAAQEAVRNVLAHAHASHLALQVRLADGRAALAVTDDGQGFEVEATRGATGHLGLALIGEMVEAAGGRMVVRSEIGAGTSMLVELPA